MEFQSKWPKSALSAFILVLFSGVSVPCFAEPGPSEGQLSELYSERIQEDNQTATQFFGEKGSTTFHDLKKTTCTSLGEKSSTTTCKVRVEITSIGLGRHQVNDQVVLKKDKTGRWQLISGIFN